MKYQYTPHNELVEVLYNKTKPKEVKEQAKQFIEWCDTAGGYELIYKEVDKFLEEHLPKKESE